MAGWRHNLGRLHWALRGAAARSASVRAWRAVTDPLWVARRCLRRAVAPHAAGARGWLLDIGCGGKPYRELFAGVERYIGIDLPPAPRADAHADALALPFADGSFDAVLCNQVLEHVVQPARLLAEAARVLKPGGLLLLTTPQVWGLHHEPHDYFRYTPYGLRALAEGAGFAVEQITPTCGVWATLSQRLADTLAHTYARRWPAGLRRLLGLALAPVLLAGYGLDQLGAPRGDALDNVLVARKRHDDVAGASVPAEEGADHRRAGLHRLEPGARAA